jgi:hypothetical protein
MAKLELAERINEMNDQLKTTYEFYREKLEILFNDVAETKKMLNRLALDLGEKEVPFPDIQPESLEGNKKIRPDHFFNMPLATAVRTFLQLKGVATSWDEIVAALREGNFDLPRTSQAEDEARTTILRNTANFVLIGDNYFGLKTWYPEKKSPKSKNKKENVQKSDEESEEKSDVLSEKKK